MTKQIILFAPCAFNLTEASRMVEIAKAAQHETESRSLDACNLPRYQES